MQLSKNNWLFMVKIILCFCIMLTNFSFVTYAQTNALLEIDLSSENFVKQSTKLLLGTNDDWYSGPNIAVMENSSSAKVSEEYIKFYQESTIPVTNSRQGGNSSHEIDWMSLVGPISERPGTARFIKNYGVAEWINSTLCINPEASFIVVFNIFQPEKCADLVRYLTLEPTDSNAINPDTGINWAQKRIDDGINDPINIIAFELGNETYADYGVSDWNSLSLTENTICNYAKDYVEKCKTIIDLTRSVNNNIKLSAVMNSAAQIASGGSILNHSYRCAQWWNKEVINSLTDYNGGINYVSHHDYYFDTDTNYYSKISNVYNDLIIKYFNNNDIKILVTEHNILDLYDRLGDNPTKEQKIIRNMQMHSLYDSLLIAEYLNTAYNIPQIYSANIHGRFFIEYGSPWGIGNKFKNDRIYPTPSGYVLALLNEAVGGNVAKTTSSNIVASAHLKDDKKLNVVLVNKDVSNDANVSINFINSDTSYYLQSVSIMSGNNSDSKNDPSTPDGVNITRTLINSEEAISSYSVPAHSMVVLHLVPQESEVLQDSVGFIECTKTNDTLYLYDKLYGTYPYGSSVGAIVLKNGSDEENYTYDNILTASQSKIYNNIAFFKIPLREELLSTPHKIIIGSDSFKQIYTYQPDLISNIDIINCSDTDYDVNGTNYPLISNNDYLVEFKPTFSSLISPDDELYANIYYGDEIAENRISYINRLDLSNNEYFAFLPKDAIPGVYNLTLTVSKDGIQKSNFTQKFYFVKPDEKVSIISPVHDENGNDIRKDNVTLPLYVDIKNNSNKDITLTAILCGYEKGKLKSVSNSNNMTLSGLSSDVINLYGLNTENVDTVKLMIWEYNEVIPLTNIYYIK